MAKRLSRQQMQDNADAAALEVWTIDQERADHLEEIGKKFDLLPQLQQEIDACRSETRLKDRQYQLRRTV